MYQNLTSDISQSRPHTSSIFMSFSIKSGTRSSKMKWKPEPEVVFHAMLAKNQISGFSRRRISAIRLCSAATRSADRSVDRRRFGPPSWIENRTATPRQSDSDHAECSISLAKIVQETQLNSMIFPVFPEGFHTLVEMQHFKDFQQL